MKKHAFRLLSQKLTGYTVPHCIVSFLVSMISMFVLKGCTVGCLFLCYGHLQSFFLTIFNIPYSIYLSSLSFLISGYGRVDKQDKSVIHWPNTFLLLTILVSEACHICTCRIGRGHGILLVLSIALLN